MDYRKMRIAYAVLVLCSISITSCEFNRGSSNNAKTDSVKISMMQKDSIMQSKQLFAELSQEMRDELYNILWEIDEIAGETFELERKRENEGAVEPNTADRIKKRIAFIKEQIENAEKMDEENPQLRSILRQLKSSMEERETEIERLKTSLNRKKSRLQEEYDNLKQKKIELEDRQVALERSHRDLESSTRELHNSQNTAWSKVGDKLMESVEMISVTKKRNLGRKVKESKQKVIEQAIRCYRKSKALGDPMADTKIRLAESTLQQLKNDED